MADKIGVGVLKELAPETVRLIASTQVITSVVSVVKELVENSLDAGSNCIEVKLEKWGLNLIEVRDNGCGMTAAEVQLAALPNYTSKIEKFTDLQSIHTYGFRGEALASLCAVSDVTISTKMPDDQFGTAYQLDEHGKVVSSKPVAILKGTWITACMLFKNFPVRKQLYDSRKKKEELRNVENTLKGLAIAVPNVRFTLVHDGMMIWKKSSMPDERQAFLEVLDVKIIRDIVMLEEQDFINNIHVIVYLPKKNADISLCSRCQTDLTFVFVNKRHVRLKFVEKLLKKYFCTSENIKDKYPVGCVFLSLPPEDVDVNMSPNKTEVLINNMDNVATILTGILEKHYGIVNNNAKSAVPNIEQQEINYSEQSIQKAITFENDENKHESQAEFTIVFESLDATNDSVANTSAMGPNESVQPQGPIWSTGRLMNSSKEVIEPVRVHVPRIGINKSQTESGLHTSKKRKAGELGPGQKTICDLLGTEAVKRPKSSADIFIQEKRQQNLDDNSASDDFFPDISEDEWDAVMENVKKKCEKKATSGHSRFVADATKYYEKNVPILQNGAKNLKNAAKQVKTKEVSISLTTLKHRLSLPCRSGQELVDFDVIGQIHKKSLWICRKNAQIGLLNTCDIEETMLCDSWMCNHVVPIEELKTPIPISKSDFGNKLWQILLLMQTEKLHDGYQIIDNRLVNNGFRIAESFHSSSSELKITGIASCIPYYGISDLKEILEMCETSPEAKFAQLRPVRVVNYIKNEVSRMEQKPKQQISRNVITKKLQHCDVECRHGRRIFIPFFKLSSMSVSF